MARRHVSIAAIIASGVNAEGRRAILGLGLGPSEALLIDDWLPDYWRLFVAKWRGYGCRRNLCWN